MNPVEIWEGIDTGEETGRNRLTKLAIHILSVIANSAGCERAFSHMGLVHTGIRSKLGIEKVRKATAVGMDLKRMHAEAGLLRVRSKRSFTSLEADIQNAEAADDVDESESPLDFEQLSRRLILGAASANGDKDVGDSNDVEPTPTVANPPAAPLTITIPPLNSSTFLAPPTEKKISIPLRVLFTYPSTEDLPSEGMNSFWRGGIQNLEKEMEAHDLLNSIEESDGETNHEASTLHM